MPYWYSDFADVLSTTRESRTLIHRSHLTQFSTFYFTSMDVEVCDDEGGDVDQQVNALYTESTVQACKDRLWHSYRCVCIGLVLFFASCGLFIWNEGRAVQREQDLQEGMKDVVPVPSVQNVDTSLNGKLVYMSAELSTNETLLDPIFNVSTKALKFHRDVEMFQWREEHSTGKKRKSYRYSKVWSSISISSSNFKKSGHKNPSKLPLDPLYLETGTAMIGAYTVGDGITSLADWYTPWTQDINISTITDASLASKRVTIIAGGLYFGNNTQSPSIGDTRVNFEAVLADTVSVIAMQEENGQLGRFITPRGGELLLVRRGRYSAEELFSEAQSDNEGITWIWRFVGFSMMFIGVSLVFQPIATFVDVIPFIGDCMGRALSNCICPLVAFIITVPLSLFTISLSWIAYRPMFAGTIGALIAIIVAVIVTITLKKKVVKIAEHDVAYESVVETPVVVANICKFN